MRFLRSTIRIASMSVLLLALVSQASAADEVRLVQGLDGGEYEPYRPALIEKVQRALMERGLYEGEAHGRLDENTMEAIAAFQREHGIHASGVPSPLTRKALFDAKPTDEMQSADTSRRR